MKQLKFAFVETHFRICCNPFRRFIEWFEIVIVFFGFFAFYLRAYFQLSLPLSVDCQGCLLLFKSLQGGQNLSILRWWFLNV